MKCKYTSGGAGTRKSHEKKGLFERGWSKDQKASGAFPGGGGHLNLGGKRRSQKSGEKSGVLSQKLRMKEQTFVSNVNERSKTLENESFPLAFSKLALLRKSFLVEK